MVQINYGRKNFYDIGPRPSLVNIYFIAYYFCVKGQIGTIDFVTNN